MALTYPQRGFAGAAVAGTIASPGLTAVDGAGATFTSSTTLTGWTEIANGSWSGDNICVTFGYGTASEEKILCTFNSGTNTFTVVTRGYDGTSAVAHTTGSLFINTFTATEAAELNAVTQSMKGLLLTDGSAPLPADISTSAAARGTSTKPAAANHTHLLSTSTLNGWLTGSASGAMNSAVSVYLSSLAAGALPTAITTSKVWSANGTGASPASLTGVSGYNNYIIVASHINTSGTTVGDNSATITANSQTPAAATLYTRSTGTSGNHSSGLSFTTGAACGVTTTAAFNISVACTQATGTSNTHTLFVIGLN
jgi:hypothetical protein